MNEEQEPAVRPREWFASTHWSVVLAAKNGDTPRASKQTGHYEAITGGDSLALALLEVHAAAHGLTNRIPSNTIDR